VCEQPSELRSSCYEWRQTCIQVDIVLPTELDITEPRRRPLGKLLPLPFSRLTASVPCHRIRAISPRLLGAGPLFRLKPLRLSAAPDWRVLSHNIKWILWKQDCCHPTRLGQSSRQCTTRLHQAPIYRRIPRTPPSIPAHPRVFILRSQLLRGNTFLRPLSRLSKNRSIEIFKRAGRLLYQLHQTQTTGDSGSLPRSSA